ncbi:hypothetical protein D3C87_2073140 [compost metagenome]
MPDLGRRAEVRTTRSPLRMRCSASISPREICPIRILTVASTIRFMGWLIVVMP